MAFCTHCGQPVGAEDVFCGQCGVRLIKADTKTNNEPRSAEKLTDPAKVTATTSETKKTNLDTSRVHATTPSPPAPAPGQVPPAAESASTPALSPPVPPRQVKQAAAGRPPPRHPGRTKLSFLSILLALAWLVYSSGLAGALAGSYPVNVERFIFEADWTSVGLMIGLPLGISILQPVLDVILLPIQPIRFRIPRFLLVGMGLCAPFATSWWLYNVMGYSNYEFLHMTLIAGTLISYVLLRTPARYSA